MTKFLLAAASIAALAAPAAAQMGDRAITRTEVETQVNTMFARLDTNRDDYVTLEEGAAARKAMGGRTEAHNFESMDTNIDGSISRAEYDRAHVSEGKAKPAGMAGVRQMNMDPRMGARMFGMADTNRDGRVSLSEARTGVLTMFDMADTDRNGTISPAERMTAMKMMRAMQR